MTRLRTSMSTMPSFKTTLASSSSSSSPSAAIASLSVSRAVSEKSSPASTGLTVKSRAIPAPACSAATAKPTDPNFHSNDAPPEPPTYTTTQSTRSSTAAARVEISATSRTRSGPNPWRPPEMLRLTSWKGSLPTANTQYSSASRKTSPRSDNSRAKTNGFAAYSKSTLIRPSATWRTSEARSASERVRAR
jgi:hypothetical protein